MLRSSPMPSKSRVDMLKADQLRVVQELSSSLVIVLEGPGKHHPLGEGFRIGDPRFTSGSPEI
jgi:hypothetical protein